MYSSSHSHDIIEFDEEPELANYKKFRRRFGLAFHPDKISQTGSTTDGSTLNYKTYFDKDWFTEVMQRCNPILDHLVTCGDAERKRCAKDYIDSYGYLHAILESDSILNTTPPIRTPFTLPHQTPPSDQGPPQDLDFFELELSLCTQARLYKERNKADFKRRMESHIRNLSRALEVKALEIYNEMCQPFLADEEHESGYVLRNMPLDFRYILLNFFRSTNNKRFYSYLKEEYRPSHSGFEDTSIIIWDRKCSIPTQNDFITWGQDVSSGLLNLCEHVATMSDTLYYDDKLGSIIREQIRATKRNRRR